MRGNTQVRWTAEEDALLREAIAANQLNAWTAIAAMVPGRNDSQCAQRWDFVLKPGLKKGHWSASEDEMLLHLVRETGKNFSLIAARIPGRSIKQCRERFTRTLDPAINRAPFSPEEDAIIIREYGRCGSKWSMIAKLLNGRTGSSVKNRGNALLQRKQRGEKRIVTAINATNIAAMGKRKRAAPASATAIVSNSTSNAAQPNQKRQKGGVRSILGNNIERTQPLIRQSSLAMARDIDRLLDSIGGPEDDFHSSLDGSAVEKITVPANGGRGSDVSVRLSDANMQLSLDCLSELVSSSLPEVLATPTTTVSTISNSKRKINVAAIAAVDDDSDLDWLNTEVKGLPLADQDMKSVKQSPTSVRSLPQPALFFGV